MLPFKADIQTFEQVVKLLHGNGRVLRDEIIEKLFDGDVNQSRLELERVARASKTDAGMEKYMNITGQKGFIQATLVHGKSYYESVIADTIKRYNPRDKTSVEELINFALIYIKENPNSSSEGIASKVSKNHGYVLGSILPSIGILKAFMTNNVKELQSNVLQVIKDHRAEIYSNSTEGKAKLKQTLTEVINSHEFPPNVEIASYIMEKLERK